MRKLKLALAIILTLFIGSHFKNASTKGKEVKLTNEEIGNFYNEYIITKQKNGMKLKDYFNDKEIFIKKDGIRNIITLEEKYRLLQLDSQVYLKSINKVEFIHGISKTKIGENYIFKRNDKYGVFDKNLNILIEPIYDEIFKGEKNSLLLAKKNDKYGYLNFKGDIIIPFEYEMGAVEKNGLMVVKKDNKIGVINQNNKDIIKFNYEGVYYDKSNNFIVLKDKEYFSIDTLGKIEKLNVSWMGVQKNEKIFYEKDNKFGIFDFEKGYITENIYDELSQNYNELIIAKKDGKYGLINNAGKVILSLSHDFILPVGSNYFKVGNDSTGLFFLINQKGEIRTNQLYDDFTELNKKNIVGVKGNKLMLINQSGKEIKKIDSIINFNSQMLLYKEDGKNILRKL